jgi:hypothetical protein
MRLVPHCSSYRLNEICRIIWQTKQENVTNGFKGVSFNDAIGADNNLYIVASCISLTVKHLIRSKITSSFLSRDPEELVRSECMLIPAMLLERVLALETKR